MLNCTVEAQGRARGTDTCVIQTVFFLWAESTPCGFETGSHVSQAGSELDKPLEFCRVLGLQACIVKSAL